MRRTPREDIYLLRSFQEDVKNNGYYGAWYISNQTFLSDTTKNIIKAYGGDRLGKDDFENIIKMVEVLQ